MTVTYRDATPADLPAVDALFRASFDATFGHLYQPADYAAFLTKFSPEAWAAELAQPDLVIRLAEEGDTVIGFVKVSDLTLPAEPSGTAMELRQLYLSEGAKGRGVADTLMDWAVEQARQRGADEIFLSVWSENERAKAFYVRHGFVDVGPYQFMVGSQADEDRIFRRTL